MSRSLNCDVFTNRTGDCKFEFESGFESELTCSALELGSLSLSLGLSLSCDILPVELKSFTLCLNRNLSLHANETEKFECLNLTLNAAFYFIQKRILSLNSLQLELKCFSWSYIVQFVKFIKTIKRQFSVSVTRYSLFTSSKQKDTQSKTLGKLIINWSKEDIFDRTEI